METGRVAINSKIFFLFFFKSRIEKNAAKIVNPVIKNLVDIKKPKNTFDNNSNNNDFFELSALLKKINDVKRKTNWNKSKRGVKINWFLNIGSKLKHKGGNKANNLLGKICAPNTYINIKAKIAHMRITMFSLLNIKADKPIKYFPSGGVSGRTKTGFMPLIKAPPVYDWIASSGTHPTGFLFTYWEDKYVFSSTGNLSQ